MTNLKIREAVGVFENQKDLDEAIAELESTAFPRQDISVLGGTGKIEKKGGRSVSSQALEDDASAPRAISIRPEEKTIGAAVIIGGCAYAAGSVAAFMIGSESAAGLATALTLGSLAGGLAGAIIVLAIAWRMNNRIKKRISRGGLLLWVRTEGKKSEDLAQKILSKHGAKDIHIHSIS